MRIHINLKEGIVREVDDLVGSGNRSEYIAHAVSETVKHDRRVRLIEEGAGILTDEDYPHFSTPEKIAAWFKEMRETPSFRRDPIDEVLVGRQRGDELVEGKGASAKPRKASRAKSVRSRG